MAQNLKNDPCTLFLGLAIVLIADTARAVTACGSLPPPTLRLYDIAMPVLDVKHVPAKALDHVVANDALGWRHTIMLTTDDVVSIFKITHQIVPQPDGSVCDAPSEVTIGFGSARRIAYLVRDVAGGTCVHLHMLAHAEAHAQSFNAAVDRFIDQRRDLLTRGMATLKQMPAKNPGLAKARWETGMRMIVGEARRQLLEELHRANAATDDPPSLATLADACGGKIRQLEMGDGL